MCRNTNTKINSMSLKIVVLAKQVPDTRNVGKDAMKADGTINRAALPAIFNPEDLNALEQALRLKDAHPGSTVTILTMGPGRAADIIREGLFRGADNGYLLTDRAFAGADTLATSYALATAIRKIGEYDIIIGGRQAIDGDTAQVGPQIAEKLHLPQVTYVADIQKDGNSLTVKRMLEDGYMTIKAQTPCLITCIKELNTPRYMSVSGVFECYSKPMTVLDYNALKDHPLIDATTIGLKGSPTNILTSFTPPQKGAGQMLEGNDMATCEKLAGILLEKHII